MPDSPSPAVETSPEEVAFKLVAEVLRRDPSLEETCRDKARYLDLYAECLLAVRDPTGRLAGNHEDYERVIE